MGLVSWKAPSKYTFGVMVLCMFYPLTYFCQQSSYFRVISGVYCRTVGPKAERKLGKTFQEMFRESNRQSKEIESRGNGGGGRRLYKITVFIHLPSVTSVWHVGMSSHSMGVLPARAHCEQTWTQQLLFLGFSAQVQQVCKITGIWQGNYKRLKAYFEHLLSSYNDLATKIGTKMQKRERQRVCLYGAHPLMRKIEK